MKTNRPVYTDIDNYISGFPEDTQQLLEQIRTTIKLAAPDAEEKISYGMPAFDLKGILVYFAAFKNHIGFFPTATGIEAFRDRIADLAVSKGTIRFPAGKPIPFDLITDIVKFRVTQNMNKTKLKSKKLKGKL